MSGDFPALTLDVPAFLSAHGGPYTLSARFLTPPPSAWSSSNGSKGGSKPSKASKEDDVDTYFKINEVASPPSA